MFVNVRLMGKGRVEYNTSISTPSVFGKFKM